MYDAENQVINKIHEAVELAIENGWFPKRFVQESQISWEHVLREKIHDINADFDYMLRTRLK